jgi:voltage-gated potassium channel
MSTTPAAPLRTRLHGIIFEAETPAGQTFDILLIGAILASVGVVMMESVAGVRAVHGPLLVRLEWFFTLLFTVEYLVRLWVVRRPLVYARSLFGIVDLLAILPTWLAIFVPGAQALVVVRTLRVLRIFRVLRMVQFVGEARVLAMGLRASRRKVTVFLIGILSVVSIVGAILYLVEPDEAGFTSLPASMYWAVVTLTTVGYGDIVPVTAAGKVLATVIMILGYGVIAVPTGIVSAEMVAAARLGVRESTEACPSCGREGHDREAIHCKWCGARLNPPPEEGTP